MNRLKIRLDTNSKILVLFSTLVFILILFIQFSQGADVYDLFFIVGSYISTLILALFVNWILSNYEINAPILALFLFVPNIFQMLYPLADSLGMAGNDFFLISNFIYYFVRVFVLFRVYSKIKKKKRTSSDEKSKKVIEPKENNTLLEKVIFSVEERLELTSRRVFFSLIAMIVIVLVGSGASFGTVALNEVSKVRELESERQKLFEITEKLDAAIDFDTANSLKNDLSAIRMAVLDRYGRKSDYKDVIKNIEKESYISWPDIAMRITIAALTLFLVQIFFHIYKYNQRQESQLLSKIEVFKLYTDEGAELNDLRKGLVSNAKSDADFDKSPGNPTEQIINIIGKAQK